MTFKSLFILLVLMGLTSYCFRQENPFSINKILRRLLKQDTAIAAEIFADKNLKKTTV